MPEVLVPTLDIDLPDEAATRALAGHLAAQARRGDVIGLSGDLGTGKTVLARAFIAARAGAPEEVPSPTFTLVQMYDLSPSPVYHFDLYRVNTPEEAVELDIDDAFADGISLIEWPERLGPYLPEDRLDVALAHGADPGARRATLTGHGAWADRMQEIAP